MDILTAVAVETTAGLAGVFAGVVLALWIERRRKARHDAEERARCAAELEEARRLVLSSVVSNTSEAKRLRGALSDPDDPYLFQVSLELAVWEALQAHFVRMASVDERVLMTRFFNQVARLIGLIDFHRDVVSQLELRQGRPDPGDRALLDRIVRQLQDVADDVRLDGIVAITDLGEPMHRRLLGMQGPDGPVLHPPATSSRTVGVKASAGDPRIAPLPAGPLRAAGIE